MNIYIEIDIEYIEYIEYTEYIECTEYIAYITIRSLNALLRSRSIYNAVLVLPTWQIRSRAPAFP